MSDLVERPMQDRSRPQCPVCGEVPYSVTVNLGRTNDVGPAVPPYVTVEPCCDLLLGDVAKTFLARFRQALIPPTGPEVPDE